MVGATRLVVPMLADFSAITLVGNDSEGGEILIRTASAHERHLDEMRDVILQDPVWEEGRAASAGQRAARHH